MKQFRFYGELKDVVVATLNINAKFIKDFAEEVNTWALINTEGSIYYNHQDDTFNETEEYFVTRTSYEITIYKHTKTSFSDSIILFSCDEEFNPEDKYVCGECTLCTNKNCKKSVNRMNKIQKLYKD